jgi:hypothetical protein
MSREVREETPRGRGAVSVVRVRGEGALLEVARLCARSDLERGVPHLVRLRARGSDLDEAIVCARTADDVEVHLHGSPLLVRALIDALTERDPAPRPAAPMTAEARARELLARAPSESGARILLDQSENAWRSAIERIALSDEPLEPLLAHLCESTRVARFALEPARVVLAGPVNAGKSTLFNALAGERRALTSDEPGTTRDLVRAIVPLGRYAVELVDTAGERETAPADTIEREGQQRARAERLRADLVLRLTDAATAPDIVGPAAAAAAPAATASDAAASDAVAPHTTSPHTTAPPAAAPERALHLWTCADRVPRAPEPSISSLRDPAGARSTITRLFLASFDLPEEPWEPGRAAAFDEESRALLQELAHLVRTARPKDARGRARSALRDLRGPSG